MRLVVPAFSRSVPGPGRIQAPDRQFLHFSEATARENGIEAQQHQLLLAVQGLPEGTKPTIREVASTLFIQHHSVVEVVNRLEVTGTITRTAGAEAHRTELERAGPELACMLNSVLRHSRKMVAS
jgi:DNA-binding MarR family transcriptional regulator